MSTTADILLGHQQWYVNDSTLIWIALISKVSEAAIAMNDLGCYRISEGLLYKFYDAILSKADGVPSVFFSFGEGGVYCMGRSCVSYYI